MVQKATFAAFVLQKWLPSFLSGWIQGRPVPAHILFCMADHFEPGTGGVSPIVERERMELLQREYPTTVKGHQDCGGNVPRRTWFFPSHYHRRGNLRDLVQMCEQGFGEIELHLHHGKTCPDTEEHLERTIRLCLDDYSKFGIFGTEGGRKRYGFIHGDWALANSRKDGQYCGVNNEIDVLCRTGCYADFTMPSATLECNPTQINAIYYARNDPHKRVPYNRGVHAKKGVNGEPGLLIVQGPLHPWFVRRSPLGFRAFTDAVSTGKPGTPRKVDCWVATWIHVKRKRDWVVIKVSTHGAVDSDVVLGDAMSQTFEYLERKYNTGDYRLHYVTAPELYNIIKAAEDGADGDPEKYRDYKITAPKYDASPEILEASSELQEAVAKTYAG
jgi:hypothetical protein